MSLTVACCLTKNTMKTLEAGNRALSETKQNKRNNNIRKSEQII